MNSDHNDLEKIEDGLSNKLIYRITEKENTKIIIDFSRDKQEFKNFLTVYEILQKINISIPKIYEVNQKQYKIYMQDFGENRFNKIYNKNNLYKLLKLAVENIIVIQNESNLNNLHKPSSIASPTFPILITYELNSSQIYHYDLYRVKSIKELEELDFFENLNNNITFIEWPEMLISLPLNKNHYLINLDMISETKRNINICFKLQSNEF